MEQEEKKRIHKKITRISLIMLVVVLAVMFVGIFSGFLSILAFQLIAAVYLLSYWALTDIVEPRITKALKDKEPEQLTAYKKYVAADLLGYLGLLLFVFTVGLEGASNYGFFGVVVYALTMNVKQKFRRIYAAPVKKKQHPTVPNVQEPETKTEETEQTEQSKE